jgi:hypothetical protein
MSWTQSFSLKAKHSLKLVFWRATALAIDGIVRHKETIAKVIPFTPLLVYGAVAYMAGWFIAKIILTV